MIEIKNIHEILKFISVNDSNNILVLDIDNTILKTKTFLGSDQWYSWQSQLVNTNDKSAVAKDQSQLNQIINHMYSYLNYELCESETPNVLSNFRKNNFEIILLTARGDLGHQHLYKSLRELNISKHLNNSFSSFKGKKTSFKDGIIYCNGGHKGHILRSFLKENNYNPDKIFFVDDKLKNLERVQESLPETQVFLCVNQEDNIRLFNQCDKQEVIQEYYSYLKMIS